MSDYPYVGESKSHLWYMRNVSSRSRFSEVGRQSYSDGVGDGSRDAQLKNPISVDTYLEERPDLGELTEYCETMKALKGKHPTIMDIHGFHAEGKRVVTDGYIYSMLDGLDHKRIDFFFKSENGIFKFTEHFRSTVSTMAQGLSVIESEGKKYSKLSLNTVLIEVGDKWWANPRFVDIYKTNEEAIEEAAEEETRKKKSFAEALGGPKPKPKVYPIWISFGELIENILKHHHVENNVQYAEIMDFVKHLKKSPMPNNGRKILSHPAIMKAGNKLTKIIELHGDLQKVPQETNYISWICNDAELPEWAEWTEVAYKNPYLILMIGYRKEVYNQDYDGSIHGLITIFRNASVHLKGNVEEHLKYWQNHTLPATSWREPLRSQIRRAIIPLLSRGSDLKEQSKLQIEGIMESLFPNLMTYLYRICLENDWVK